MESPNNIHWEIYLRHCRTIYNTASNSCLACAYSATSFVTQHLSSCYNHAYPTMPPGWRFCHISHRQNPLYLKDVRFHEVHYKVHSRVYFAWVLLHVCWVILFILKMSIRIYTRKTSEYFRFNWPSCDLRWSSTCEGLANTFSQFSLGHTCFFSLWICSCFLSFAKLAQPVIHYCVLWSTDMLLKNKM